MIQNGVDFAATTVWADIDYDGDELRIAIGDDGPGFSAEVLPRLGEPYVSTRQRGEVRVSGDESEYEGMGLGLFIARTLLQRTGATMAFANGTDVRRSERAEPEPAALARPPGAIIEMIWPSTSVVTPKAETRQALGPNQPFARRA